MIKVAVKGGCPSRGKEDRAARGPYAAAEPLESRKLCRLSVYGFRRLCNVVATFFFFFCTYLLRVATHNGRRSASTRCERTLRLPVQIDSDRPGRTASAADPLNGGRLFRGYTSLPHYRYCFTPPIVASRSAFSARDRPESRNPTLAKTRPRNYIN